MFLHGEIASIDGRSLACGNCANWGTESQDPFHYAEAMWGGERRGMRSWK